MNCEPCSFRMTRYRRPDLFCLLLLMPFCFNHPATTDIYTLSLHDALPIGSTSPSGHPSTARTWFSNWLVTAPSIDRKSTRLYSSHVEISYAASCLKKKKVWLQL